jgi:hypothetical protein
MILGQPLFFSVQGFNFGKANIKTWRPGSPHFPRTEACSKIRVQLSSQPEQIDKLERRRQYLEVEVKALSKEKVPQGGGAMMAMFFLLVKVPDVVVSCSFTILIVSYYYY